MVALIYFPRAESSSIIDRFGLNFCVRNGNRYFPKPRQYHRYYKRYVLYVINHDQKSI